MKILKKLILVLVSIIALSGCSSDDSILESDSSDLIGNWNVTSSIINNKTVTSYSYITFTPNNRVRVIYEGFGNNGQDIIENGTWEYKANVVTITWDSADLGLELYKLNIMELTDTNLKWSTVISGEGTLIEELVKI